MPEEIKEVKIVQIDFKCPNCTTGYLRPTGQVFTTMPPMFQHRCNNPLCNYTQTFTDKQYPYIDYEPVKKDGLELLEGE